jgi:hypothetical protein
MFKSLGINWLILAYNIYIPMLRYKRRVKINIAYAKLQGRFDTKFASSNYMII